MGSHRDYVDSVLANCPHVVHKSCDACGDYVRWNSDHSHSYGKGPGSGTIICNACWKMIALCAQPLLEIARDQDIQASPQAIQAWLDSGAVAILAQESLPVA